MKKPNKITPAAIVAFKRAMSDEGTDEDEVIVHMELGLPIWHCTVFEVDRSDNKRPDWIKPEEWERATELRRQLIEATKETRPSLQGPP